MTGTAGTGSGALRRLRPSNLTIRVRLTLVYGGLFLVAGVALLGVTYALVHQQLPRSQDTVSGPVGGAPEGRGVGDAGPSSAPSAAPSSAAPSSGSSSGERALPEGDSVNRTYSLDGVTPDDTLDAVLTQGAVALAVIAALATLLGWLIAGRLLQPLHRMTETARRIAEAPAADRGLHERIALEGPQDEVKRLADTFDVMLERIDHAFDGQRRFIANASHELRTPLALNQALLEVVVFRRAVSEDVRQMGETLMGINHRHEQLIDGLLLLARSEHEVLERSFVDLADIVEHVAAQTPAGAVTVTAEPAEATTSGNPALLERLVQNLLENGIRHNVADGGWVRVGSRTGPDGSAVVEVANTGPVVPPYEVPTLFEPFRRLGGQGGQRLATASHGAGLGLSIVRAVARAHGGDVHAEPREGGGLTVTATLPAASEQQ
ncbi:sensor histidine kinase [Streptomyces sp. NPDC057137]|uniref:sensor histidine kinase n=1 Tax=Streptomyces sp. NPDC057137 TaxID=3346030 RepID=UPI003628C4D9